MGPRVYIIFQRYLQETKNCPILPAEPLMARAHIEDVTTLVSEEGSTMGKARTVVTVQ